MSSLLLELAKLNYWGWFGIGAILLGLELFVGGGFLFWTGIAAAVTAVISLLIPIAWPMQLLCFAILALVISFFWWRYLQHHPLRSDRPTLNRRSEQYIGRIFTVKEAVINGRGFIIVDDTRWPIQCREDLPAESKVKIIAVDGVILFAEKI
jgi:hypothetical protein